MDPKDVEFIEEPKKPLPHDGWRSRKAITGCAAGLLVFFAATIMAVWSGRFSAVPWFEADYWVKSVWVAMAMWGFAFGLLTIDKVLELIRIVLPILGQRGK